MNSQDGELKLQTQARHEPSPNPQVTVTKEDLTETLTSFISGRGAIQTENVGELSTFDPQAISNKAFDAFQRWIDFSGRNIISFYSPPDSDWTALLPSYLYQRMKDELGGEVLAIFHKSAPGPRVDNGTDKATMKFLTLLTLEMLRALPSGRCARGVLIEKEMEKMTGPRWPTATRLTSTLHTISWLVQELGPGIVFFLDGGMDALPKHLAEELVGIILGPKHGNKICLSLHETGDGAASSYQELFWERNDGLVGSFEFDLSLPSARAPRRKITELAIRGPQRTPHPLAFTKIQGGQGKFKKRLEQLKQWVAFE